MPAIPPVTTAGLDDTNRRRRHREVTDLMLNFQHDDSRIRTPAEVATGVIPVNQAFQPGDVKREGASYDESSALNKTALQSTIDGNGIDAAGAAVVVIPADIKYGYDTTDLSTHPDFSNATAPVVVIDYGAGESFAGYPTGYDGAQIRKFFHTPQTTATVTFTASISGGATSATLTGNWAKNTGRWVVTFSNGDVRNVTFTNGATTATWTGGLSSGATSSATYVNPGQHQGNTEFIRSAWAPGIFIVNDANLAAVGDASRLALDNRRAQLSFGNDGEELWKIGQGSLVGPGYTDEVLSNFYLTKVSVSGDTIGDYTPFLVERKTGNMSFGAGANEPGFSYYFYSVSDNFDQACFDNSAWDTQSIVWLRESNGQTHDCGLRNNAGTLSLYNRTAGDGLLMDRTTRRITVATSLAVHRETVTYSTSMTIDAATGTIFTITATDGVAFAINAPTNPVVGEIITIVIRNTSGGALGAVTWNAVFKMSAWTQPADGFSRSISFQYDNTNWIEYGRTPADVPN